MTNLTTSLIINFFVFSAFLVFNSKNAPILTICLHFDHSIRMEQFQKWLQAKATQFFLNS
jgi:hypothetical protein